MKIRNPLHAPRGPRLALLASCIWTLLAIGCGEDGEQGGGRRDRAPAVSVEQVVAQDLERTVRGIGTIEAAEVVEIRPEIDARVTRIAFREGESLAAGSLLFALDDRKLRAEEAAWEAQKAEANVRLNNASRRLARYEPLAATNAVSADQKDEVQTQLEAARADLQRIEAELQRVRERLADTRILAPFDGVTGESMVDPGDFVSVSDHLVTLYRIDPIEAAFRLPSRHNGEIEVGQRVTVETDAKAGRRFEGEVVFVSPAVEASTRDFLVKARIENEDLALKPGAFATALVTVETRPERPVIPERALVATRTGYIVFVVEGDVAHRRDVSIGLRIPGLVEVTEGVEVGEKVIEAGHMNVAEGATVRVVEPGGNPAG